jgi:hypothetical protein
MIVTMKTLAVILVVAIVLSIATFMTQNVNAGLFADLKKTEQDKAQAQQDVSRSYAALVQACANLRDAVIGSANDPTVTPNQFEERVVNYNFDCGNVTGNITTDTFRSLGGGQ